MSHDLSTGWNKRTHGEGWRPTPEYRSWMAMLDRCRNPNNGSFHRYGGRGITVCQRWRRSYIAFLEDMGRRPSIAYTLDRIDNDGNYEPGNCRWATAKVQGRTVGRPGESNPSARLCLEQVRIIRRCLNLGMNQQEIAPVFSISQMSVSRIKTRATWSCFV